MFVVLGGFVAGILTILAPCVLPALPLIIGGSATRSEGSSRQRFIQALIITSSLGISVAVFTLLLKATTFFIDIPLEVWTYISGGLLIILGVVNLFPGLWASIAARLNLQGSSHDALHNARERDGVWGMILTGAALGPVFSSCSPMYLYVVVTVLPSDFGFGLLVLAAYCLGLTLIMLAIAFAGQTLVRKLGWAVDQDGWFKKAIGIIFIVIGIMIISGLDKQFEAFLITHSPVQLWNLDSVFVPDTK